MRRWTTVLMVAFLLPLLLGTADAQSPRDLRSPALYRVSVATPVQIGFLSDAGEVGILAEKVGVRVIVSSPHAAEPLVVVDGPQSNEVVLRGADVPENGPVVVTVEGPSDSSTAWLRWDDPDWYARAPTVGHIAAVVAVGLLVVLHHGRSPRRYG